MGLIDSVNKVNNSLVSEAAQKRAEKEQRQVQIVRNNLIKDLFIEYFKFYYERNNDINNVTLKLIKDKKMIIGILKDNYKNKYDVTLKKFDIRYMNDNYIKWINEAKKEYEIIAKIKLQQQKEAEKQQKELLKIIKEQEKQQKIKDNQPIYLLDIILYPIIFIICFIFALPFCIIKRIKKDRS
jgi:hypothetical protein